MSNYSTNFKYFTILTLTFSGTAGLIYFISRKFFLKQLSSEEEKGSDILEKSTKEISYHSNMKYKQLKSPERTRKNEKKKSVIIEQTFLEIENCSYTPDDDSSDEKFKSKKKKSKEFTKTSASEINSYCDFKISNPINLEFGSSCENFIANPEKNKLFNNSNRKLLAKSSKFQEKSSLEQGPNYNNDDYFYKNEVMSIKKNTYFNLNSMDNNLSKNKRNLRLSDEFSQRKKQTNKLYENLGKKTVKFSLYDSNADCDRKFFSINPQGDEMFKNDENENLVQLDSSTEILDDKYFTNEKNKDIIETNQKVTNSINDSDISFENKDKKMNSNIHFNNSHKKKLSVENNNIQNSILLSADKYRKSIDLNFKKNGKTFCSKIVNKICKKKSKEFDTNELPNGSIRFNLNEKFDINKNINYVKNDCIVNILTSESNKNDDSINTKKIINKYQDYSNISDNREINNEVRKNQNDTTFNLIRNFKEEKDLNFTNEMISSNLFNAINKTNFLNSFDNPEDNHSFDFNTIFDEDDIIKDFYPANNPIYRQNKIGLPNVSFFDKRNDVSEINHEGDNYFMFNNQNSVGHYRKNSNNSNNTNTKNKKIIENDNQLEEYLRQISESIDDKDSKDINSIMNHFNFTIKTYKFEIKPDNNFANNNKFKFEIINPEEFCVIIKYLYNDINRKLIDLFDHYKTLRRKTFDDSSKNQVEYTSIIKEYLSKRNETFNKIFKEYSKKLNLGKKILFDTIIYFILLSCYNNDQNNISFNIKSEGCDDSYNISISKIDRNNILYFFDLKKFEKYYSFFKDNNLFLNYETNHLHEITFMIIKFNYVGIKEVLAPKILNYDRLLKILNFQNKKIKELASLYDQININVLEIMLSDYTYSEYGIDNEAIIAAYKKIKPKIVDYLKIDHLNSRLKEIKYYKILFMDYI